MGSDTSGLRQVSAIRNSGVSAVEGLECISEVTIWTFRIVH